MDITLSKSRGPFRYEQFECPWTKTHTSQSLKHLNDKPWFIAALIAWGIALFEYLLQVPANRIGFTVLNLAQLKILQEVITLAVFVPFAMWYMGEPIRWNYLWAGLCLLGAVYFIFKG